MQCKVTCSELLSALFKHSISSPASHINALLRKQPPGSVQSAYEDHPVV